MNAILRAALRETDTGDVRPCPLPDAAGRLSPSEAAFADEAKARETDEARAKASALEIHAKAVQRARDARTALLQALGNGLRPMKAGKSGGVDAMIVLEHCEVSRLIDAHARAQAWLREAAQGVSDAFEFDGRDESERVEWETPLATRPTA